MRLHLCVRLHAKGGDRRRGQVKCVQDTKVYIEEQVKEIAKKLDMGLD